MYKTQLAAHESLSENLPEDQVSKWKQVVDRWLESPGTGEDPFEEPRTSQLCGMFLRLQAQAYVDTPSAATVNSTRLKIAEEEAEELAAGTLPPHDVTPGIFIHIGLDLEDQQYVFTSFSSVGKLTCSIYRRTLRARAAKGPTATSTLADIQEKRNLLKHWIEAFQAIQDVHMAILVPYQNGETPFLSLTLTLCLPPSRSRRQRMPPSHCPS